MATLYRKYRSQRFEDVIGQEPIITTLTNQIKLGRIGHAYLFTGSRGIGKTSCARIFARAVNCLHPVNGSPCGECEVCKKLAADNVDIIEMDAASNNGVDDARDIREKVKYLPVACKYKVYIIDEVHMLTGGAFNALLKTIEEPPDHVIFILATTEPQKLPQTILSRCIRFDFKLVPADVLAKHVARVYDAEGIKYTADAVEEIARLGAGSVRDALSVADTLASAADVVTKEVVLNLTGSGETGAIAELFGHITDRNLKGALESVDGFAKSGKSMSAVCRQLIDYTRNVLVAKSVGGSAAAGLINADSATLDGIVKVAEKCKMDDVSVMLVELGAAENGLKYSVNPRVFLETALVKLICIDNGAEQKKNKPKLEEKPAETPKAQAPQKPEAAKAFAPPPEPEPEYIPEPDFAPPPDIPDIAVSSAAKPPKRDIKVSAADEGEFWHLRAQTQDGMELLGKISIALRKLSGPSVMRTRQLLSRGVAVKEREDYIAFIAPDDTFLSIGEPNVIATLNGILDGLGIKKRAKAERTEDDLFAEDILRAQALFGKDGVVK